MKIIYKHQKNDMCFEEIGVETCIAKQIVLDKDIKTATKKEHHHRAFEIHIINTGHQTYKILNKKYKIKSGSFLIIPPDVKHSVLDFPKGTIKTAFLFGVSEKSPFISIKEPIIQKTPSDIIKNIEFILKETKNPFYKRIIEGRIFEILVSFLNLLGYSKKIEIDAKTEDVRLIMAKEYIKDNIELNLKVGDVASYCYLGTKQLTRLFKKYLNITPSKYIEQKKIKHIENLISESDLSLKAISEKMNFSSEYHFNSFFKKHNGMPPGEYKKIHKNSYWKNKKNMLI